MTKKDKKDAVSEDDKKRTHERITQIIDQVSLLFRIAVIGAFVFLTACAVFYWPVQVSAGKETTINVVQSVLGDFKIDVVLAWTAAGGGILWGYAERKAKLRERKEKDERIISLEIGKDPNRTSSGLNPEGKPR